MADPDRRVVSADALVGVGVAPVVENAPLAKLALENLRVFAPKRCGAYAFFHEPTGPLPIFQRPALACN